MDLKTAVLGDDLPTALAAVDRTRAADPADPRLLAVARHCIQAAAAAAAGKAKTYVGNGDGKPKLEKQKKKRALFNFFFFTSCNPAFRFLGLFVCLCARAPLTPPAAVCCCVQLGQNKPTCA
jgi:hypothetical protein